MSENTTQVKQTIPYPDIAEDKFEAKTMLQIVSRQFLEHKMAVVSLIIIGFFILVALSAPLISSLSGINPDNQDVFNRYKPPMTRLQYSDDRKAEAIAHWLEKDQELGKKLVSALVAMEFFEASDVEGQLPEDLIADSVADFNEAEIMKEISSSKIPAIQALNEQLSHMTTLHVLGTDELGRDVLVRLIYGTRVSIGVGVLVAFAASIIGLIIGCLAGFYGGFVDTILMRVTDSLLSLPLLPLLIVFAAIDMNKVPLFSSVVGSENESIFKLVAILVLFSWMTVARLVRGSTLSVKEREFIQAAKTLGAKDGSIILRHIVPNIVAPLLVAVTLNVGRSILFEAALSFLGLGIQPPIPSWGNMLFNALEIIYEAPLLAIFPGLMIFIVVISFNFVGDGLQDAIDPKAIKR